jgi:putative ATP-dependent endonuclease of OLD family
MDDILLCGIFSNMRLVSFTIENYRSITDARRIGLEDYTVLLGPNNEGKSNILNALNLGMEAIRVFRPYTTNGPDGSRMEMPFNARKAMESYDWKRDFPIALQEKLPQSSTLIGLDFELTEKERQEFKQEIGSSISEFLPLKLAFGPNRFSLTVSKQGKGQKKLNKKGGQICAFVHQRVRFEYIPAIRTVGQASSLISRLIERELKVVEERPEYQEALEKIESLERPVLESLSASVTSTVKNFLPGVSKIKLELRKDPYRTTTRRAVDISIDDGVSTHIERKGEGVQSLVALSIMRHIAQQQKGSAFSVIAIDEPESHLHPEAARELRQVMMELSGSNQVVLSSHSPLFVHLTRPSSNIIVQNKRATPAKTVRDVRECLGVRLSDNLQNAELVLLLEGEADRVAISSLLMAHSSILDEAMKDGRLGIDTLGSASGLSSKASFYKSNACKIHCFMDNDEAGKEAIKKALDDNYISLADYHYAVDPGKAKSEFEDLVDENVYLEPIKTKYDVDVSHGRDKKRKWSERVRKSFFVKGRDWEDVKNDVKTIVANCVARDPKTAIHNSKFEPIQSLIRSLEKKLTNASCPDTP